MGKLPGEVVERYLGMIPPHVAAECIPDPGTELPHLRWMLNEMRQDMEVGKAMRWLGFVQGMLISRGFTTVTAERDFTRPFFSATAE